MKRRVLAGIAAVLLAAVGAVLLMSYVAGADQRAMAGMQTVRVLVVTKAVPQGTAANDLSSLVTAKVLPVIAVAAGAVSNVSQLAGRVATTDLKPGEQVLSSRFGAASSLPNAGQVKVPAGMQEISVALDPQRVIGGHLTAGAKVALFLSMPKDGSLPANTQLLLQQVLITRVEGGIVASASDSKGASSTVSSNGVMVTLAVTAADAEQVVFGAENGTIWLSRQPADAVDKNTGVVTAENVGP